MDFQLGAEVRRSDGAKVGETQRLVVDLETGQLVSLVVLESRVDGHEVVVPIGLVNASDDNGVDLGIDQYGFETLEAFKVEVNTAPPPNAANVVNDEIKDPVDVPDVPPVGAATGVESIAFTPVVDEFFNIEPGDVILDGQTSMYATDADMGRILGVRVNDQTERVESILVTRGLVFEHHVVAPWESVRTVQEGSVVLSVPRADLTDLDDE